MRAPVIVGFDGSVSAHAAVEYGVQEAQLRGCELHLLHAFSWPLLYPMFDSGYDPQDGGPRLAMRDLLAQTAQDIQRDYPGLSVHARLIDGSPGGVLMSASVDADLLVVGHRGLGGFAGLLAGSVGIQAAGHADCPVVIVRGDAPRAVTPIVLGVDGSPGARRAADVAFRQAQRRGVELLVAFVSRSTSIGLDPDPSARLAIAGDRFAASLDGVAERFSDVKYRTEVLDGDSAATALIAAARHADAGLLVVGSRGVGGFHGLVMGSTSRSLIEHAPCPVMVVPR